MRHAEGVAGGGAERAVIADRPVGVQRQHLCSRVALRDPLRSPRQRWSGRGRPRLGEDLGPRDLRYRGGDLVHEEGPRENQYPLGGHEPFQSLDRLDQQRPIAGQR